MDAKQADKMLEKICQWLRDGAQGSQVQGNYDTTSAETAREMSYKLLKAAGAKDDGGCPLCRS